jgi:glycosyltransferase involved in cell wall biosynthesis
LGSSPSIGLLHYTCPPVIGGVETILYEQATRLRARGYPVTILAGRGGPLPSDRDGRVIIIPELDSKHSDVTALREQFDHGTVPPAFFELRDRIRARLDPEFATLDVLIAHNVLTMHFNLALTAALWSFADRGHPRLISWGHDLAWLNPLYRAGMHPGEPWDLLRRQHPKITSIFVSAQRLQEWHELTGAPTDPNQVIPNGVDPAALLKLPPTTSRLIAQLGLADVDVILLAPVRITRRKNLEWAIEAAAAVEASGRSVRLLITGPPGPHDPRAMDYVEELRALANRLGVGGSVRFLFELKPGSRDAYPIDASTLSDLYMLSDVVTLPSASEGFGLPLAEAAILRVPVVATEAFRAVAPEGASLVPLAGGSPAFSAAVLIAVDSPAVRTRRRAIRDLSWDRIIRERLEPLLSPPH